MRAALEASRAREAELLASTSWRVSAPVRWVGSALRMLLPRKSPGPLPAGPPPAAGPAPLPSHGSPNPEFDPAVHLERVRRWQASDSDARFRAGLSLGPDSIVLDLGSFDGDFAAYVSLKFGATCHAFEVVPEFCERIRTAAAGNAKLLVHPFGLAGATRQESIFLADEGSSTFVDRLSAGRRITIDLVRASDWFSSALGARDVDLMKINIEGGEYELLEHMLEAGLVGRVRNLLVQFHEDVMPGAARRMQAIQAQLERTHRLTFQESFVWENWERRD